MKCPYCKKEIRELAMVVNLTQYYRVTSAGVVILPLAITGAIHGYQCMNCHTLLAHNSQQALDILNTV